MSSIKQEVGLNEFIPSVDTELSIFPNNTQHGIGKYPIPQLNDQRILNGSNEQQANTNTWCIPIDSNLKKDNSQTFLPRTRSFSLDLTNLYSVNNVDNINGLSQTPTFTNHDFNSTNILSSKQYHNGNTNSHSTSVVVGDEDSNSDDVVFSPRNLLSRPSSISSSSLNEIVDAVAKAKKIGKEKKRRVKKVKASHNDIERKYRLSINDKIVQLRNLVPTIRYGFKEISNIPLDQSDLDALDGLEPTKKLNKGTILNKTIEYIKHLEAKCEQYKKLNLELTKTLAHNNNHSIIAPPPSISSSTTSSVISSTVVTPSIKTENHLPIVLPMQQEFNLNLLQDSTIGGGHAMTKKQKEETFTPLAKAFVENNASNGGNNLFKFESFT